MASITFSGQLDQAMNEESAAGNKILFIPQQTVGEVLPGAASELVVESDGSYNITLAYNNYSIYHYSDVTKRKTLLANDIVVSADTAVSTIPDLIGSTVPVTEDSVLTIQGYLTDAQNSASAAATSETNAAESAASVANRVADYEVETTEYLIDSFDGSTLEDGDIVRTLGYYAAGDGGAAEFIARGESYTLQDGDVTSTVSSTKFELSTLGDVSLKVFGAIMDGTTDDSDAISSSVSRLGYCLVDNGLEIKFDLTPDYDTTVFKGDGKINSVDPWGYDRVFDIELANNGPSNSAINILNQKLFLGESTSIGVLGDSITDGNNSTDFDYNPTDSDGNLSSTDYDHGLNGGAYAWPQIARLLMNEAYTQNRTINVYNAGSASKKLIDGWGFENFDYGFFQNEAYENKAPDILTIALGVNDTGSISSEGFDEYRVQWNKLINKAQGYGCSIILCNVNMYTANAINRVNSIEKTISENFRNITYISLGDYLFTASTKSAAFNSLFYETEPGSGTYDTVHPTDYGHRIMGGAFAYELLSDFISNTSGDSVILSNSYKTCHGLNPDGTYAYVKNEQVSGLPYLDDIDRISYFEFDGDGDAEIIMPVWIDNPYKTMTAVIPKFYEMNNSEDASYSISILGNSVDLSDTRFAKQFDLIDTGDDYTGQYKAHLFNDLYYGLNIIKFTFEGNPTKVYSPMLTFTDGSINYNLSGLRRDLIPDGEMVTLTPKSDYSDPKRYTISRIPDTVNGTLSLGGGVTVNEMGNVSLLICAKPECNRYLSITTATGDMVIEDYDGNTLTTITGDFSGEFLVNWYYSSGSNTLFIHIYDSLSAYTGYSISDCNYSGGGVFLYNNSGSDDIVRIGSFGMNVIETL